MNKTIVLAFLLSTTGCAEYRAMMAVYSAEAADASLEVSEWGLCQAATGGALERRYTLFSDSQSPKAQGWTGLCHGVQQSTD